MHRLCFDRRDRGELSDPAIGSPGSVEERGAELPFWAALRPPVVSVLVRRAGRITLSPEEWAELRKWITDRATPPRVRCRARVLLGAAIGRSNREIARSLSIDPATVAFWRLRFAKHRLEGGLRDAPRPGRRRDPTSRASERILHATSHLRPPNGARWTTRSLARHLGINHMMVHRTWKANGLSARELASARPVPMADTGNRRIDLLGVVLQPPRRAVVFGVEVESATPPTESTSLRAAIRPGISGGFLLTSGGSDREELLTVLKRMEPFVDHEVGSASAWHDLLILLRNLEERTHPTTEVHAIVEMCDATESARLEDWFSRRTRFHLHGFLTGAEWIEGLSALLEGWVPPAGAASFGGVPSFASAAAHFAAGSLPGSHGLVWNNFSGPSGPTGPPPAPEGKVSSAPPRRDPG